MLRSLPLAALVLLLAAPALAQTGTAFFSVRIPAANSQPAIPIIVYAVDPGGVTRTATADASGLAVVPGLPFGRYFAFPDPSAGYITQFSLGADVRPDSLAFGVIILETPDPLKGVVRGVLTEEGTGAPVRFDLLNVRLATPGVFASFSNVDGEGRYAFQVDPGTYNATYRFYDTSDPVSTYFPVETAVTVTAGAETVIDATVRRRVAGRATGAVTDAATGAPLAGIEVLAYAVDNLYSVFVQTGADGRFTAELPENDYIFQIVAPPAPFLPQSYDGVPFRANATVVTVEGGATRANVDFALRQPAADFAVTVRGRITDTAGRPILGALVSLYDEYEFADSLSANLDGTFSVTSTNPALAASYLAVGFSADGYRAEFFDDRLDIVFADLFEVGADPVSFDVGTVVLVGLEEDAPGFAVSGTVADEETGAPLGGALVAVARVDAPGVRYGYVDASGVYRVDGLDPGQYVVLFTEAGHAPQFFPDAGSWTTATRLDVTGDLGGINVRLGGLNRPVRSRPGGGTSDGELGGTVRDGAGAPVSGALVVARRDDGVAQAYSLTDGAGRFTLSGLSGAFVTVEVDRARYAPVSTAAGVTTGGGLFVTLDASSATAGDDGPPPRRGTLAVYPNPSRSRTSVAFALAAPGDARVAVVDVLGREVAVAASGAFAAGAHTVAVDTSRLPAGVYVVRLAAGGRVVSQTFTVVR